jgi:hypothetical protein
LIIRSSISSSSAGRVVSINAVQQASHILILIRDDLLFCFGRAASQGIVLKSIVEELLAIFQGKEGTLIE